MKTLKENFSDGDLIYGLKDERETAKTNYLKDLPQFNKAIVYEQQRYDFATIDQYNKFVINNVLDPAKPYAEDWEKTEKKIKEVEKDVGGVAKGPVPGKGMDMFDYASRLKESKKFSPALTANLEPQMSKDDQEKLRQQSDSTFDQKYYLAIRRSCKFGIEYVCGTTGPIKIHFILDTIDLKQVTTKSKNKEGVLGITGSELRYLYRNWDELKKKNKVLFYLKEYEVPAPWENKQVDATLKKLAVDAKCESYLDESLWKDYAQVRAKRKEAEAKAQEEAQALFDDLS